MLSMSFENLREWFSILFSTSSLESFSWAKEPPAANKTANVKILAFILIP